MDRTFYAVLHDDGEGMALLSCGGFLPNLAVFWRAEEARRLLETRAWFDREGWRVAMVRIQEVRPEEEESCPT